MTAVGDNGVKLNWAIVFALIGLGFVAVVVAGAISGDVEIKKTCARTLLEGGKGLVVAAIAIMGPPHVARVFTGGDRSADRIAPKEGSASER